VEEQAMNWSQYFYKLAHLVAQKSKDRSTKVGAVIVGPDHEIVSTGYNGFCRGIDDTIERRHERPEKYDWTEHAERNAIYNAARRILKGTTMHLMYAPCPCTNCTRAIIQSGIVEVVMPKHVDFPGQSPHWEHDFAVASEMLAEAGVKITYHEETE
jgi:dCMP deaminase